MRNHNQLANKHAESNWRLLGQCWTEFFEYLCEETSWLDFKLIIWLVLLDKSAKKPNKKKVKSFYEKEIAILEANRHMHSAYYQVGLNASRNILSANLKEFLKYFILSRWWERLNLRALSSLPMRSLTAKSFDIIIDLARFNRSTRQLSACIISIRRKTRNLSTHLVWIKCFRLRKSILT